MNYLPKNLPNCLPPNLGLFLWIFFGTPIFCYTKSVNHLLFQLGKSSAVFSIIVTAGEIKSLAIQLGWGMKKRKKLSQCLDALHPLPIAKRMVVDVYAQIDSFSQGKLYDRPLPNGLSARNMGKNDLWIAATAHSIQAHLVTTDHDFDHLDGHFLRLLKMSVTKP